MFRKRAIEKSPLRVALLVFVTITSTEAGSPEVKDQVMVLLVFWTLSEVRCERYGRVRKRWETDQYWDADGPVIEIAATG